MLRPKRVTEVFLVFGLLIIGPFVSTQVVSTQETNQSLPKSGQAEREAMYYRYLEFASYIKGGSITPHWMADGSSFWYAEGAPTNTVIWKVDPKANTKTPLFDTVRLRRALTEVLGHEPTHQGLPIVEFEFLDGEKAVQFTVEEKHYILQLDTYAITQAPVLSQEEKTQFASRSFETPVASGPMKEELSPDRRWFVGVKDHNLYLRSTIDKDLVQLTSDGVEDYWWDATGFQWSPEENRPLWAWWSPDSLRLAVKQMDYRNVPKMPIVHYLTKRDKVEWVRPPSGEPETKLFIVNIPSKQKVRIDVGEEPAQKVFVIGWRASGSELLFLRLNRAFKRLDLMAANPATGAARVILTETQKTFILGRRFSSGDWARLFSSLDDGKLFIWMSERDGWNHLYLYRIDGTLIRRLTEGEFPVVRIVAVEEKTGWVYFTAHGDKQRPYDTHLYRVNLEGKGFSQLTKDKGQHEIRFAPSKEFLLDTHSSVDRPPAAEIRRADGTLLQLLSKAKVDALVRGLKWSPPEEFVVKAADGKTDLHGVLYKPYDFNAAKKYPVIEEISDAPYATVVQKSFIGRRSWPQAWAQLGFIVFMVDGRGTSERGKVFQDFVYQNIGRHEISDHVTALKQLAAKRPYMDLSRVGIHGVSYGGYMAIRAMLFAPDVYHVGISTEPFVDLEDRLHSVYYLPYMSPPEENKEGYEYASALRFASSLKGKLLLIYGTNSGTSSVMKMVDALIREGKPYDLLALPEQGHGFTGVSQRYWLDGMRRYFQEHLKP